VALLSKTTTQHLQPGFSVDAGPYSDLVVRDTTLPFTTPNPGWLGALACSLRTEANLLLNRTTNQLIELLGTLNAHWADSSAPERREADPLLAAVTGYPEGVITPALDHMFAGLRAPHLEATLAEELGSVRALDGWVERPMLGTRSRAYGPRLTLVVASGNVPMAALPSVVYSLLLKSPVLVKMSSSEPVLAGLYLRSLAAADPLLGQACAAVWWPGGDAAIEAAVLPHAEAVIAFGGDEALQSLAGRLVPGVRFQPHGQRVGFGVIGRERLTNSGLPALAEAAARDAAEFDQQGCVSPQWLFVERGGEVSPAQFAGALADTLAGRAAEWPRVTPSAGASAAIHQLRAAAEVRSALNPEVVLHASAGSTAWTVLLDPDAPIDPGCLYRTILLKPVAELAALPVLLEPVREFLQTASVAVGAERQPEVAEALACCGLTRICPLGRAQRPAPGWRPDGRPRLAELVRWVDWEQGEAPGGNDSGLSPPGVL
jgi:hypothetical protein